MEQLIINQEYFSENYLPEKLFHRDREKIQLLNNLKNYISTLVYGPIGCGKSSLAKHVLKLTDGKVLACYVDSSVYQTTYSVLKEIVPRGQLIFCRSNYELLKELMKEVKQRRLVICLDDFERLKEKDLIKKFLSLGITLVLTTDYEENVSLLTEDVRFKLSIIKLKPYNAEQAFEILKDRAEKALTKWSYNDALLKKIVEKINGNITLGINLLKQAVISAESKGKKTIEESDIPKIEDDCPLKLNRDERVLLNTLKEWKSLPARRLYDFYIQSIRHPKGERSFRNFMQNLCSKGLVKAIGEKRGRIYEIVEVEQYVPCKDRV